MGNAARFLRERIPIDSGPIREGLDEPIPGHMKRWGFALGGRLISDT